MPRQDRSRSATPRTSTSASTSTAAGGTPVRKVPSCDLCRVRKVKCVKAEGAERCDACVAFKQLCVYTRKLRKPGPTSRYERESTPPTAATTAQHDIAADRGATSATGSASASASAAPLLGGFLEPAPRLASAGPAEWAAAAAHATHATPDAGLRFPPTPVGDALFLDSDVDWSWLPIGRMGDEHAEGEAGAPPPLFAPPSVETVQTTPGGQEYPARARRGSKTTRLEEVMPWSTAIRILQAYHAYLYPLMPIMHWPTFLQQLMAREDERNLTWRSYLFALLAYSIIQLPRSALPFLPVSELRLLHQRCFNISCAQQNRQLNDAGSVDVATLYCHHIYLASREDMNAANMVLASAIRLAQALSMDNDKAMDVDCIERQVRSRIWWLLYGSDRTAGALNYAPLQISEWDVRVPMPLAVDDELITRAGAFSQPAHTTSVLSGFHFVTRLFSLLGAVLTAYRTLTAIKSPDELTPSAPLLAPQAMAPSAHFQDMLEHILESMPEELGVGVRERDRRESTGGARQGGDGRAGSDAFAICRANLLVTQALARVAIQQYAVARGEDESAYDSVSTQKHLVDMLDSMSGDSLAANGDSMRKKVLYFVSCGILDQCRNNNDVGTPTYASDFLTMYMRLREEQQTNILLEAGDPESDEADGPAHPAAALSPK